MGQTEKPEGLRKKIVFQKRAEFMTSVEKAALEEVRKYKDQLLLGHKMTIDEAREVFQSFLSRR
jgi:hypothetical protein